MTPLTTGSSRLQVQCQSYQRPLWTRPGCQAAPAETEVQLEFADVEEKSPPEDQKLQRPEDGWGGPCPAEEESPPLPSSPWVSAPDQAFWRCRREVSWAWVSSVRRQGPAAWGGLAQKARGQCEAGDPVLSPGQAGGRLAQRG